MRLTTTKNALKLSFDYDEQLIEKIHATNSVKKWEPKSKEWILNPTIASIDFVLDHGFSMTEKDVAQLENFMKELEVAERTKEIRRLLWNALECDPIPKVAAKCKVDPFPYQWVPVTYAAETGVANFLLADEMGLGKTLESVLVSLHDDFSDFPVLIVCPASVCENWQDELKNLFGLKSKILTTGLEQLDPDIRFYIVSYARLKNLTIEKPGRNPKLVSYLSTEIFKKHTWILLFDESQALKNRKTKQYKRAKAISSTTPHKICMTGTPMPNNVEELYPTLSLLDNQFMSWTSFAREFCGLEWGDNGMVLTGATNRAGLHQMLVENYMIRRKKAEALPQLPEKQRQMVHIGNYKLGKAKNAMDLFKLNAEFKVKHPDFKEYCQETFEAAGRILVFAHHSVMLDFAEHLFMKNGWEYFRIDGSTPSNCTSPSRCAKTGCTCKTRQSMVREFQSNQKIKGMLLSMTAAGMGLNLTGANIAFFLEIYWQPGVIWQAEERMHRPGQKSDVLNLFPLMTDFESRYVLRVFDKINNIKRIVDGGISDDVDDNSLLAEIANEYGIPIGALM